MWWQFNRYGIRLVIQFDPEGAVSVVYAILLWWMEVIVGVPKVSVV